MKFVKFSLEYWKNEVRKCIEKNADKSEIGVALGVIAQKYGVDERNKVIEEFKLDRYPYGFVKR